MTTAIGTVGQGEFMSSKSLVEAAKIILSARPEGLSEDMLVHILLLDDRPFTGLGAHVYGVRKDKSKNSLGNKGLSALRRTKGMRKQDGRWTYSGPLPAAPKVVDDEAVVNLTPPSSPSSRCCKGCGAILRRGNIDEYCWPCETPRVRDYKVREYKRPAPVAVSPGRKWTRELAVACIQAWAEANGRPPARSDWRKSRVEGEHRPSINTVIDLFGSWNGGIEAAGFEPRPNTAGVRQGISPLWRDLMGVLPAFAGEAAVRLGQQKNSTRKALSRMEQAGWVYREVIRPHGPGERVLWHPMPAGMEKAA